MCGIVRTTTQVQTLFLCLCHVGKIIRYLLNKTNVVLYTNTNKPFSIKIYHKLEKLLQEYLIIT